MMPATRAPDASPATGSPLTAEARETVSPQWAGFAAALQRLDQRLRLAVEAQRQEIVERARDPFRGLYLSEEAVDALLPPVVSEEPALAGPAGEQAPRLKQLAHLFGLTALEQEALLICLAPELDLRYERLFGYLQDDVTRRRPTIDLLLRLLCSSAGERLAAREALGPSGRLRQLGLLLSSEEVASPAPSQSPLLAQPLRVDERIVEYLLGSDLLDARLAAFTTLSSPSELAAAALTAFELLPEELQEGLERLLSQPVGGWQRGPVLYLHGPLGTGKLTVARAACAHGGRKLLCIDLAALFASSMASRPERALLLAAREALLQEAVFCLEGVDTLLVSASDGLTDSERWRLQAALALRKLLAEHPGPSLLLGEARWEPAAWLPARPDLLAIRVELPALPPSARLRLWRGQLDGALPAEEAARLASRFRLEESAIRAVAAAARGRAAWHGHRLPAPEDVREAARVIASPPLEGMARLLEPRYEWDDIVLPPDVEAQLRELCARARHQVTVLERWGYGHKHARRAGITALFAGQPGTGKTMAAEIIAGDLGLDLYRIDLSAVVSKYIGETEKNLERIFRAADQGDAVLLFDEADALFGKRSEVRDAHDRYANVEIAYLLQRLETYDGLAILTTNLRGNIDEAFLRRLDCVMEFPLPEEPERLAIWRRAVPPAAPLAGDVDFAFLARKFKLAGGHIRNIALTAAFLAAAEGKPISMKHLIRATRREYQKLGKLVVESDFEHFYALLRDG